MWPKHPIRFMHEGRECVSIVFTWDLPKVREDILLGNLFGPQRPLVGGPAVKLMPEFLADIADIGDDIPGVLQMHNSLATRSMHGCVRKCRFCAVPRIEGEFRLRDDWPNLPLICDNNLLAAPDWHFDKVIDGLLSAEHTGIDFNQGLDARLLTEYHAKRLAELPKDTIVRLSWDNIADQDTVMDAIMVLIENKVKRKQIQCYVLLGYDDTPADGLWRCRMLWRGCQVLPNPQRYNPLDALERDTYLSPAWTEYEMDKMMRYWGRLSYNNGKRYKDFDPRR